MNRISDLYGRVLTGLALVACALLFLMMLMICADVLLRNVAIVPGLRGLAWSNEVSESMLYLITMLSAPWLLRQASTYAWTSCWCDTEARGLYCEWVADTFALACCVAMAWYGWSAAAASYRAASMSIKTLITPEWWSLAPLPAAFALLAVEVLFRMQRLHAGERGPRSEAVSTG